MAGTATGDRAPGTTTAEGATSTIESSTSTTRRAPEVFLRLITVTHSVLLGFVHRRLPVTFIGYAIISGSAFFLDITCLWVFYNHLRWFCPVAVTVGYVITAAYSLLLNRWLNLQAHGHVIQQGAGYVTGVVSQYIIFILGLFSLLHWFGVNAELARVISACCEGIYLYMLIRLWVFRGVPEPEKQPQ